MKKRHCGNCKHVGTVHSGGLFAHYVCKVKDGVGEATNVPGGKCVCSWVEKKTKPRGCPGWGAR